jgi:hypothetical protein
VAGIFHHEFEIRRDEDGNVPVQPDGFPARRDLARAARNIEDILLAG